MDKPLDKFWKEYPLDLYCSYTFDQILVALGKHTEQFGSSLMEGGKLSFIKELERLTTYS